MTVCNNIVVDARVRGQEMRKASLKERLHYAFDNSMSKGTAAITAWLAAVSCGLVVLISLMVWLSGVAPDYQGARPGLVRIAWLALLRTLDAGTMGSDTGGWPFLLAMLAVTLGGVFIISTFIGVVTSGIQDKLVELRRGRSRVIESGHTVVLGWSPQIFTIIAELLEANANRPDACIVVLGDIEKTEMEDRLRERVGDTGRTRVVCRSGDPADLDDLEITGIHASRSIIVLSPPSADSDFKVIKILLAITNNPRRRKEPYHIVAELQSRASLDTARLVGRGEAELVLVQDLLARVTAQTCRQSGLSMVYSELLDFAGDEIYFQEEPELVGRTFGEALLAYEDSSVIGLRPAGGGPILNPPMDTVIAAGDRVIAISADDDTVRLSGRSAPGIEDAAIRCSAPAAPSPERTLVLGWNDRLEKMICELDSYVGPGSSAAVVALKEDGAALIAAWSGTLKNMTLSFLRGDPADSRVIRELGVQDYKHVILLSDEHLQEQSADSRTLMTLVHLRDIGDRYGHPFSLVSEILDPRNRALAEVTHVDDFIVGHRMVAQLLAQVSENKELNAVFEDLLDPEGSEIYLKLASNYVELDRPVNFYTVTESARRRGEIAIGYKIKALSGDPARAYGVTLNPDKSDKVTFSRWDRLIVIAAN